MDARAPHERRTCGLRNGLRFQRLDGSDLGNTQKATWAWWDECVDEAYAILPAEATQKDFSPGLNFDQLKADLSKVAN